MIALGILAMALLVGVPLLALWAACSAAAEARRDGH